MSPYGYSYKASCARPSFVIFDILALWSVRVLGCKNYKWRLNLVWHRMLNSGCQRVNIFTIKPRCFRCYSAEVSRGLAAKSGYFRLLKWHDNVKLGTILACCGAVIDLKTSFRPSRRPCHVIRWLVRGNPTWSVDVGQCDQTSCSIQFTRFDWMISQQQQQQQASWRRPLQLILWFPSTNSNHLSLTNIA